MAILFLCEVAAMAITFLLFVLQTQLFMRCIGIVIVAIFILMIKTKIFFVPFLTLLLAVLASLFIYCQHVIKLQVHGLTIKEVLDSLPEAVCFSLFDGTLLFVNKRMHDIAHTLTGYDLTSLSALEFYLDGREMIEINDNVYAIKQSQLKDYPIRETIFYDITKEQELYKEMKRQTQVLEKTNEALTQFHYHIDDYVRAQEILAAQMHIHEDLGQCLLATQGYFQHHIPQKEVKQMWHQTMHLMHQKEITYTLWTQLLAAASFAHVDLIKQGDIPHFYEQVCVDLVHLCLNAAIRESQTKVDVNAKDDHITITCQEAYLYQDEKRQIKEMINQYDGQMHLHEGKDFMLRVEWRKSYEGI